MTAAFVHLLLQAGAVTFAAPSPELRDAQARFESVRRMNLPVAYSGSGRCDAILGRFCYWYDSTTPPPERPESPRIVAERERLLSRLEQGDLAWPGDPWIAGQRVRYLVDAGRADSAARLRCGVVDWWCDALRGLAFHVAGHIAQADSSFSRALIAMPDSVRCAWLDLGEVFETAVARELDAARCAERERLAAVAFRLGQPLWMTPGNDLRSELLARQVTAVIFAGSATPHGTRWGDDMRELLLRYGGAERYTRSPPAAAGTLTWPIVGHNREPHWNVMPRLQSLRTPWVSRDAWSLRAQGAPMRYSPRHLGALVNLPHQLIRIPHGDSMRVAVAFRLRDTVLLGDTVDAVLAAFHDGEIGAAPAPAGVATLVTPADTIVVSAEVRGRRSRRAARARYSVGPLACHRAPLCVSDLLLFGGAEGASLMDALARAVDSVVSAGAPLGVWWHVRSPADVLTMSLALQPRRSPVRRAVEALRFARPPASTRLHWRARSQADTASAQVSIRLPPAARGRYRISLTVQAPHAEPITATREIVVVP